MFNKNNKQLQTKRKKQKKKNHFLRKTINKYFKKQPLIFDDRLKKKKLQRKLLNKILLKTKSNKFELLTTRLLSILNLNYKKRLKIKWKKNDINNIIKNKININLNNKTKNFNLLIKNWYYSLNKKNSKHSSTLQINKTKYLKYKSHSILCKRYGRNVIPYLKSGNFPISQKKIFWRIRKWKHKIFRQKKKKTNRYIYMYWNPFNFKLKKKFWYLNKYKHKKQNVKPKKTKLIKKNSKLLKLFVFPKSFKIFYKKKILLKKKKSKIPPKTTTQKLRSRIFKYYKKRKRFNWKRKIFNFKKYQIRQIRKRVEVFNYKIYRQLRQQRSFRPYMWHRYNFAPWIYYLAVSKDVYIRQKKRPWKRIFLKYKEKNQKIYWHFWKMTGLTRNIKNLHALKIIYWKFSFYCYGKINKNRYNKIFNTISHKKSKLINRNDLFFTNFETRTDCLVYRTNWGKTIQWAKNLVKNNWINIQTSDKYKLINGI